MTPLSPIKRRLVLQGARCEICPLRDKVAVLPEPARSAFGMFRYAIVGEGPGRTEEKLGRPFVGMSGKFLDRLIMVQAKLFRGRAHVTNAMLCRGESDKENETARKCCAPRLLTELAALPREAPIVLLGSSALQTVLATKSIILSRGFIWTAPEIDPKVLETERRKVAKHVPGSDSRKQAELAAETFEARAKLAGRTILPTLHPAFVLRSETWHAIIKLDFARIGRVVRGEVDVKKLADVGSHVVTQSVTKLRKLGPSVSLDVETTVAASPLLAKLLCVGLSDGLNTIVLWPWSRAKMASKLLRWLRTRREVVGHNLFGFDRIVLERNGIK